MTQSLIQNNHISQEFIIHDSFQSVGQVTVTFQKSEEAEEYKCEKDLHLKYAGPLEIQKRLFKTEA